MTSFSGASERLLRRLRGRGEKERLRAELAHCHEVLGRIAEVCTAAAAGQLEARVLGDPPGPLGTVAHGVNRLLDLTDAYVRESTAALAAAGEGRFYRRFLERGMLGAFGTGARTINRTAEEMAAKTAALEEAGTVMGRLAEGDFRAGLEGSYDGAYARLQGNLNAMVAVLRGVLERLHATSDTVAATSGQLRAASQGLAESAGQTSLQVRTVSAASEQAGLSVQTVAAAAEEMSASIEEISRQLQEALRVSREAAASTEGTVALMDELGADSQQIGEVVRLITRIAEQTNLLALNATIEAARAGEAGKGFAVVANEVKQLASQTSAATAAIAQQVQGVQDRTRDAVARIRGINEVIARIDAISTAVAAAMEEQSAVTRDIARSVAEAAHGTREVSRSIGAVNQEAGETASGAEQGLRASEELTRVAAELESLMGRFRV